MSQIRMEEYSALEQEALVRDVTLLAIFALLYMTNNYLHRTKSPHMMHPSWPKE